MIQWLSKLIVPSLLHAFFVHFQGPPYIQVQVLHPSLEISVSPGINSLSPEIHLVSEIHRKIVIKTRLDKNNIFLDIIDRIDANGKQYFTYRYSWTSCFISTIATIIVAITNSIQRNALRAEDIIAVKLPITIQKVIWNCWMFKDYDSKECT